MLRSLSESNDVDYGLHLTANDSMDFDVCSLSDLQRTSSPR